MALSSNADANNLPLSPDQTSPASETQAATSTREAFLGAVGAPEVDNSAPQEDAVAELLRPDTPVTVVGLGASAGGIGVLQTILEGIPAESGLSFVVVMHLSPDYESNLAQVLQSHAQIPVTQVNERVRIEPDHVYVIPPSHHLVIENGELVLTAPQQSSGSRVAIDLFFRTLAAAYGQRAVCAVLSGTDSDGVIGLKHVKGQGGVTIAQNPDEAEFDSMPRSAIETGMVDWILRADEIAPRLLQHVANEQRLRVPPEEPDQQPDENVQYRVLDVVNGDANSDARDENPKPGGALSVQIAGGERDENALYEVLVFLRAQTGHDFAHYKRATILRRVARRLQVNSLGDIPTYLQFLRANPPEAFALLQDLLISVTNFFRDTLACEALQTHVPQLFAGHDADQAVRVWVCGCATGEEAYSVAILLKEHAAKLPSPPPIQIFATDLDDEAITFARAGLYPPAIEADVSPERLRRFFTRDVARYRIRPEIRECVLFATHNVLKDPPFSRMNLVTCRNLLIYLKREAQERVFDIFHFALRGGGTLFLGGSESVDDTHMLFAPLDKKYRVYVRRAMTRPIWQAPLPLPSSLLPPQFQNTQIAISNATAPNATALSQNATSSTRSGDNEQSDVAGDNAADNAANDANNAAANDNAAAFQNQVSAEISTSLADTSLTSSSETTLSETTLPETSLSETSLSPMSMPEISLSSLRERSSLSAGALHLQLLEEYAPPSVIVNHHLDIVHMSPHVGRFLQLRGGEPTRNLLKIVLPTLRVEVRSALFRAAQSGETVAVRGVPLAPETQNAGVQNAGVQNADTATSSTRSSTRRVDIIVRPIRDGAPSGQRSTKRAANGHSVFLVVFDELERGATTLETRAAIEPWGQQMETELQSLKEELSSTMEQHEVSAEGFKAANEELQSMNEELRSTSEELQTSKEELQAVNEELTTVNQELKSNIEDLARTNSDLQNLLTSTEIGTIFLDRELRIKRFTPRVQQIFNVLPTDVGRPLSDITNKLDHEVFIDDAQRVLETLCTIEREVHNASGQWFGVRLLPYRTIDNHIDGVVLTFVDITSRKQAEEQVLESEVKYHTLFDSIDEGFCLIELIYDEHGEAIDYRFLDVNRVFERQTGLAGAVGKRVMEIAPQTESHWLRAHEAVARTGEPARFENYTEHNGSWYRVYASRVGGEGSRQVAVVFDDITERKRREANLAFLAETSDDFAPLLGAEAMMSRVGQRLGDFLGLSRCNFSVVDESKDHIECLYDWRRDDSLPSVTGAHHISTFLNEKGRQHYASGKISVVDDTRNNSMLSASLEALDALGVRSVIDAPYRNEGRWKFLLTVARSETGKWHETEIELIRELTERIYIRIERALADAALRTSEERFRALIGKGADMITVTDRDGGIMYASPTTERISGYTPEEFMACDPFTLIHPDDVERCLDALRVLVESPNLSLSLQHRVLHKDGSWHWIEGTFTSLFHEPAVGGIVANVHDITESKAAEEALRGSQERLRIALDGAEMGAWNWNTTNDKVMWNDQHYRLFGLEPCREAMDISVFLSYVLPEDQTLIESALRSAVEEIGVYETDFRIRRADTGEVRWMSGYGRVVEQQDGRATLMSGVVYDSTARKTAVDNLRRAHEELEDRVLERTQQLAQYAQTLEAQAALLELAHDAILVRDANGIITFWNHGAQELFGWSAQQSLGQNAYEWLFTQFPQPVEEIERQAQSQGRWEGELTHTRRDGREVVVQSRWATQRNASGEVISTLEINSDITSRKAAEAAQRGLMKRLVDAQEDERKRISRELHDQMGQSLTALMMGLKALPSFGDSGISPPSPNARIDQLQNITQELTEQVHRMAWELRPAVLDNIGLEAALRQLVEDWSARVEIEAQYLSRGWRVFENAEQTRLPSAVESTLYRVVQEALNNVQRHANATQVDVILEHSIPDNRNIEYSSGRISLTITDNGRGFDYQATQTDSKRLGLLGMKERIELINGHIHVESAPTQGTTVSVRVPIEVETQDEPM